MAHRTKKPHLKAPGVAWRCMRGLDLQPQGQSGGGTVSVSADAASVTSHAGLAGKGRFPRTRPVLMKRELPAQSFKAKRSSLLAAAAAPPPPLSAEGFLWLFGAEVMLRFTARKR